MPDYHQIADQIRSFVQSSDQTRDGSFDSLASAYNEACTEVNQRMGRCSRLLQQGLRSEAIQLADSEPRLLDAIAALDFPERADWDELLRIYDLPPAPKLAVDQAQFLNESYAQENPLQDLLRTHRRLALQRAPLRSRITTMRKLAAQDSNNPIWNDDLKIFEKARFREVQLEASEAAKSHDLNRFTLLLEEVEQQIWVESPPKALVQALRKVNTQLKGQQTRGALTDLDTRLNDAFAVRDAIRGRIARQEWIALTATAAIEPGDPIRDRVGPSLAWLEDQDRMAEVARAHEEAVARLAEALDDSGRIRPAELERLAHAVLKFDRGMPEETQRHYVARLRSAQETQTRTRRLVGVVAAASFILISSLAFYLIRGWTRGSDATQAAATIHDLLDLGELEQAGTFLKKLRKADSGLLAYSPLIAAQEKFQAAQDKETDRIVEFDRLMRAVEQVPANQLNPPELEAARKLARLETENQAVEQLVKRRAATLETERKRQEKDLAPRMTSLSQKIADIQQTVESESFENTSDPEILRSIAEAQRELTELGPAVPFVGEELQSLAAVLGQRLETVRSRLEIRGQQVHLEKEITNAVGFSAAGRTEKLVKFVNGLDEYVKSLPKDPRSEAFKRTRDEQTLWYAVEEWNKVVATWTRQADGLTSQEAKLRAEQFGSILKQHPAFPDTAEFTRYKQHAEAVARRGPGENSPTTKLRSLLSDILVDHVWMVTIKSDPDVSDRTITKRYYSAKEPEDKNNGFLQFSSIISFEGTELSRTISKDAVVYLGLSPQSQIADQFKPLFADEKKLTQWDALMTDLVEAILHQPDIDPILQVALLRKVVGAAVEGSESLRESLQAIKNHLDEAPLDVSVPWMNPDTLEVSVKLGTTQFGSFDGSPRVAKLVKQALARSEQIERDVAHYYQTVGWLARSADGWRLKSGPDLPRQGDLWVVATRDDKRGEWRKIGQITDGKSKIDTVEASALAEGRPVFVIINAF